MKAKVCRYYDYDKSPHWHVAVYLLEDPEMSPHDYDLYLTSKEWRKLSGLRSPKSSETMEVDVSFKVVT